MNMGMESMVKSSFTPVGGFVVAPFFTTTIRPLSLTPTQSPPLLLNSFTALASARTTSAKHGLQELIAHKEKEKDEKDPFEDMFLPPGFDPENAHALRILPNSNIFLGPEARDGKVKHAEFVKSSARARDCPVDGHPEFALLGRSNVGKSSLINALVRSKDLAGTSKRPGKTQLINHFLVDKSWYLVDLPGYGFANVPNQSRTDWNEFTKDYFLDSETLVCVLLLIDASIPPQQIDLECVEWLTRNKIPVTLVYTKCDRKKKKKDGGKVPAENVKAFNEMLKRSLNEIPPWLMTSSVTGQGKDELLIHIAQLRNYWRS